MGKHSRYAIDAMHNSALHNTFVQKLIFQLWNLDLEDGNPSITIEDLEYCTTAALEGLAIQYGRTTEYIEARLDRVAPGLIQQALDATGLLAPNEPEAEADPGPEAHPEPEENDDDSAEADPEPEENDNDSAIDLTYDDDQPEKDTLLELLLHPRWDDYEQEMPAHEPEPPTCDCCIELLCLPSRCCTGVFDFFHSLFEPHYVIKL